MRFRLVSVAVLGLVVAGCGREVAPTSPSNSTSASALQSEALVVPLLGSKLDSMWPNRDGLSWTYDYRSEFFGGFQPSPHPEELVPPAPSPEQILPYLRQPFPYTNPDAALYGLRFDGMKTTESGAVGQNLVETLTRPGGGLRLAPALRSRLLARIALARPDLRSRLGVEASPADLVIEQWPLFVHGGAWEKTPQYIGTYGDVDLALAWKFLDADLRPGATFRHQLVPSLADDVFLTGWVVPQRQRDPFTRGRLVEVAYVIDYGVSEVVDGTGATLGYTRWIGYGNVLYMPGVGPVFSIDRPIASTEDPGHPPGQVVISLRGSNRLGNLLP